jgi:hypothetical protein
LQVADQLDGLPLTLHLGGEFLLGRQVELVAGGVDLGVALGQGVADHGLVLVGAQDDAERRVLVVGGELALVVVQVLCRAADYAAWPGESPFP